MAQSRNEDGRLRVENGTEPHRGQGHPLFSILQLRLPHYRAALERDPQDLDTHAHFGQCLLRQKRAAEARPLLEGVIAGNSKYEYGYTMMALAETLTALGDTKVR